MTETRFNKLAVPSTLLVRVNDEEYSVNPYRNEFQRDRDRILYSKAFRRLSGKTQVFLPSSDDHIRTRLTHTVEVAQLSKTVGQNLGLNLDLIEAIALGHDLGHAPFGHIGERTLNLIMNNCDHLADFQDSMEDSDLGFKHNYQSIRVTTKLARIYGKEGLNLTNFTNWGILNHSKTYWKDCESFLCDKKSCNSCYLKRNRGICVKEGKLSVGYYLKDQLPLLIDGNKPAWSFEGFVVGICDEIAQRHHDVEDGLISKIIDRKELSFFLDRLLQDYKDRDFGKNDDIVFSFYNEKIHGRTFSDINELISFTSKLITNLYCTTLIEYSKKKMRDFSKEYHIKKTQDFEKIYPILEEKSYKEIVGFPEDFQKLDRDIHNYLRDRILNSHLAQQMDGKGRFIIRNIFKAYLSNPRQMHDATIRAVYRNYPGSRFPYLSMGKMRDDIDKPSRKSDDIFQIALLRAICDNIAGMTDNFAITQYRNLYG